MTAKMKIKDLTIIEKLQTMELLWDDICHDAPDFSSPGWHEEKNITVLVRGSLQTLMKRALEFLKNLFKALIF